MAKAQKLGIIILCCFFILASLPSYAETTVLTNHAQGFAIWNFWDIVGSMNASGEISAVSWADATNTPTFFTCAFKFPMIANLYYQIEYSIDSNTETTYDWMPAEEQSRPLAVYSINNPIEDIPLLGIDVSHSDLYSDMMNTFYNPDQLIASSTEIISSTAQAPRGATFCTTLMPTQNINDEWTFLTFKPHADVVDSSNKSYNLTMSGVRVYYNSAEVGAATLNQLSQFEKDLELQGIQIELINTQVQQLSGDVKAGFAEVESQINTATGTITDEVYAQAEATRAEVIAQGEATQEAINSAADQAHSDSVAEQEKLDNVGEDVAENIAEQDKLAGNEAQQDILDGAADQENQLNNSDEVGKLGVVEKISDFWGMLNTTEVATSIRFPGANNPFTGDTLWEEQTIDLTPWLTNPFIKYMLQLVRVIFSLGMLWWVLRLYYDALDAILNKNAERSIMQVVLHLNPFK